MKAVILTVITFSVSTFPTCSCSSQYQRKCMLYSMCIQCHVVLICPDSPGNSDKNSIAEAHTLESFGTVKDPASARTNQFVFSWPFGTYGLPMTVHGCLFGWSTGSRFQDNEDTNNANTASRGISTRMNAIVNKDLLMNYCVKVTNGSTSTTWPAGRYCIARKGGVCPTGFSRSSGSACVLG